jgi:SAM-dependent methyltransferase
VPFNIEDLRKARQALTRFRSAAVSHHHERYSFPFFAGSYFAYRKVDVLRIATIARTVSTSPSYLDVGCGYGDFLNHIKEYLPDAEGIEKDGGIFYGLGIEKPSYIRIADAHWIDRRYDLIFVGWMEPGQDFRDSVAHNTDVIVTTLDQGISLAAEFDGHGFQRTAWWRTPSWEDVNTEIMNRHYTKMAESKRLELARMRGAHNLWYVYSRPQNAGIVREALKQQLGIEPVGRYEFESVLDECGYGYMQKLENPMAPEPLWQVEFG